MKYTNYTNSVCLALAFLLLVANVALCQTPQVIKWVVEKNSSLRVAGKTNVNSFACSITEYAQKDTIVCSNNSSLRINLKGALEMDILDFNCNSSIKTNTLRKTLNADVYPKMFIHFLSLQHMPALEKKPELIAGWVLVELAGVLKKFELSYTFSKTADGVIQLMGCRSFRFSDFNLSPPTKFGGLVKIKDDFDVNFQLSLRGI